MATDESLKSLVEAAFRDRELLRSPEHEAAVLRTIERLDRGELRVAVRDTAPQAGGEGAAGEGAAHRWVTHAWIKEAILLYFALRSMSVMEVGPFEFHDKIPLK